MMATSAGAKVLIVEDEFLVALQLEDILLDGGYDVVGIVPDRASLRTIGDAPQVALVDLNLRDGHSGPGIALQLSKNFGTKVIYVTANPTQLDSYAPTAIGIVQKPFSEASILAVIDYALDRITQGQLPPDVKPLSISLH
jgi:DNA-binding response OmpR family regulator